MLGCSSNLICTICCSAKIRVTCIHIRQERWKEQGSWCFILHKNIHFFYPEFHPFGATMTSHVKLRKERVGLVDYDTQIKGKITWLLLPPLTFYYNPSWLWSTCVVLVGHKNLVKTRFSLTARLSEWVIFSRVLFLLFPFRGTLPACRPAEGVGLATGAEEPAAAGPDGLPSTTGRDWKRVRPLPWQTCWTVHLQDQEVKAILPLTAHTM